MWRDSIPFWKVMSPCDTQSSSIQCCNLFNTDLAKAYNVSAADTVNVLSCNIFIHWPVWYLCLASQRIYTCNNFLWSPYDGMYSHYSHYCSTNSKRTILPIHKGLACLNSSDPLVSTSHTHSHAKNPSKTDDSNTLDFDSKHTSPVSNTISFSTLNSSPGCCPKHIPSTSLPCLYLFSLVPNKSA